MHSVTAGQAKAPYLSTMHRAAVSGSVISQKLDHEASPRSCPGSDPVFLSAMATSFRALRKCSSFGGGHRLPVAASGVFASVLRAMSGVTDAIASQATGKSRVQTIVYGNVKLVREWGPNQKSDTDRVPAFQEAGWSLRAVSGVLSQCAHAYRRHVEKALARGIHRPPKHAKCCYYSSI